MITKIKPELDFKNNIDSAPSERIPENQIVPYFYVSENRIVIAPRFQGFKKRHKVCNISKLNLKKPKLQGKILHSTSRRIENQLTTWLNAILEGNKIGSNKRKSINYYPVFLTLTLSSIQSHSDNFIKRHMLGAMIKNLKRNYGVKYYFWRAEKQQNGNIHFHLVVDKYIDFNSLRHHWNMIQKNNGYIDSFEKKFNHSNPNSVDVRSASNVKNFTKYVVKYMTKDAEYEKVTGRLWGMSDELRNLKQYCDVVDDDINDAIAQIDDIGGVEIYIQDHFTVLNFTDNWKHSRLYLLLSKRIAKYYLNVFKELYILPSPHVSNLERIPLEIKSYFEQAEIHFPRT